MRVVTIAGGSTAREMERAIEIGKELLRKAGVPVQEGTVQVQVSQASADAIARAEAKRERKGKRKLELAERQRAR
jgi:hypothetical protein